ncbi:MAG TPA: hypothetical protein VHD33_02305 [Legionellaceae bacterium]|nr:hypothetical protein [Legionellaceae bacterium]
MAVAWIYGLLLWVSLIMLAFSMVYGVAYVYKKISQNTLQSNKGLFFGVMAIIAIVIASLAIFVAKKLGIYNELEVIIQITALLIATIIVVRYLLKRNRPQ